MNTIMSPATIAAFSFWPALNRPCGGSGPRRATAQRSQRASSASRRSMSAAPRRSAPSVSLSTSSTSPAQNASAAPRWMDFHSCRLAASSANAGR